MVDMKADATTPLTHAARKVLRPMGMFQKGRSRIWLADNTWWMSVVEFQPSNYDKGSYLNVGCMWFWNVRPGFSFDEGYRIDKFHRYESENQFSTVAEQLSQKAAKEVIRYQTLFSSIHAVSDHYLRKPPDDSFWPEFNAAIAHGLSGRAKVGAALLTRKIGKMDTSIEWQKNAASDAEYLLTEIAYPDRFEKLIAGRVLRARDLHKVPRVEEIDFSRIPSSDT
jgi:hypothetical protein